MDQLSTTLTDEGFRRAFRPRPAAILGASSDPARLSGRALHYRLEPGYDGAIYPVNNRRDTVQGIPALASLDAAPETPDVALLALSAAHTLDAVHACVAKGAAMRHEVIAAARAGGLRLFGPNCLGLFHAPSRFIATFTSALDEGIVAGGNVAVVSGGFVGMVATTSSSTLVSTQSAVIPFMALAFFGKGVGPFDWALLFVSANATDATLCFVFITGRIERISLRHTAPPATVSEV